MEIIRQRNNGVTLFFNNQEFAFFYNSENFYNLSVIPPSVTMNGSFSSVVRYLINL